MKAALLDIDGTLIDSNDAHASAWADALAEKQIRAAYPDLRRAIGMGGDHLLPSMFKIDAKSAEGRALSKRRGEIFRERYLPKLSRFSRADDLLRELKTRGLKTVVATSASNQDCESLLKAAGLFDLIDVMTNSSDAEHSKPDPDILLAAIEKSGCAASEVFMIGDTPYDLEAATRAKVRSVAFKSGGWDAAELTAAREIYAGPADFLAHILLGRTQFVAARGLHTP